MFVIQMLDGWYWEAWHTPGPERSWARNSLHEYGHGLHSLWRSHFGVDEHPFATYFGVHQGYRALTHSHMFATRESCVFQAFSRSPLFNTQGTIFGGGFEGKAEHRNTLFGSQKKDTHLFGL